MKGNKSRVPGKTTPPNTEADTTETTTANNTYVTNRKQVQNRGNINRNNQRTLVETEDNNYEGDTSRSAEYFISAQRISPIN